MQQILDEVFVELPYRRRSGKYKKATTPGGCTTAGLRRILDERRRA